MATNDGDLTADYEIWKRQLKSAMASVMAKEVADAVKEHLTQSVDKRVYAAYTPENYKRRGANGGLADTDNYESHVASDENTITLTVSNETGGNPDGRFYITDVIENGSGHNWNGKVPARPFMEEG